VWNLVVGDEAMFSEDHLFVVKKSNVETEYFRREIRPGIRHGHRGFGPEDDDHFLAPHQRFV
jgi:hypothetical protein